MALSLQNEKKGETTLEKKGREAREEHLKRNEWIKGYIEYTKQLVQSEYRIQNEFKVS